MKTSTGQHLFRAVTAGAAFALVLAACGDTTTQPTSIEPPVGGTSTATVTSTTDTPATSIAATPSVTDGVVVVDRIEPVNGEAPVRLREADLPVVYMTYRTDVGADVGDPPPGLELELISCSMPGPGTVIYELDLAGDGVAYPFSGIIIASLYSGDVGTGTVGQASFVAPGRQLLVSSIHDQFRPFEMQGHTNFRQEEDTSELDPRQGWVQAGMSCEIEFEGEGSIESESQRLVDSPRAIQITAPKGTVEAIGQAAFAEGSAAAMAPLAVSYGEALRLYAERWFIPEDPVRLITVSERLEPDRCLEVEFTYESYTVLQQRGCVSPATEAVFEAGSIWFATATDGEWLVRVSAADRDTAVAITQSLRPLWHMFHRPIPLTPVNETEIGRVPYGNGEVLITFGEQRCLTDSCLSPEGWFYVYRIVDGALEEYAHYPGWDGCLFVEEDPFVLAVAPRWGSISVDGEVLDVDEESRAFVFFEKTGEPVTITMVDGDGAEPLCIEKRRGDERGGIEAFPGSDAPEPAPAADRVSAATDCSGAPLYLADFTDVEPLRQACADTEFGRVTVMVLTPNEFMADEPDGLECLVVFVGSGASASCFPAGADGPESVLTGDEGFEWLAALVPDGTSRITATTSRGTELIGLPHDRLVLLWWRESEGDLRDAVADTPNGLVTLSFG